MQKWNHNIGFWEKCQFFAKNCDHKSSEVDLDFWWKAIYIYDPKDIPTCIYVCSEFYAVCRIRYLSKNRISAIFVASWIWHTTQSEGLCTCRPSMTYLCRPFDVSFDGLCKVNFTYIWKLISVEFCRRHLKCCPRQFEEQCCKIKIWKINYINFIRCCHQVDEHMIEKILKSSFQKK
jgi:hypothetical protein